MGKLLSPMELYHAAKETCVRLYVANGGDKRDQWEIRPYPGTAAISRRMHDFQNGVSTWTLCMPAFPLEIRLPRWKADLIAAYTVHELLHALWTDWDAVKQSRAERLHSLVNALEDNRIEAKATTSALVMVTEARRLLEALNEHIARRALGTPGFALDDAKQFSFVLNLAIFHEHHRYASPFPANWRDLVRVEWLPMFDLALTRFPSLQSTGDCLRLARDLKALAATLPKPAPVKVNPLRQPEDVVRGEDGEGGDLPPMPLPVRDAEITEPAPERDDDDDEPGDGEPGDGEPGDGEPGDGEPGDDPTGDDGKPEDSQEPGEGAPSQPGMDDTPAGDCEAPDEPVTANEGANEMGGRSDHEPKPEAAEDLSDDTQVYAEAHLDDLAAEAARDAGKFPHEVKQEGMHAATVLNVRLPREREIERGGNPKIAAARIASPAKLRRHLTMAVKSPERVAHERYQVSGRLDLRNLVGLSIGAPNVFRRRVEEEGREAAVSILMDVSGSMSGERIAAAKAMALHMGDALKAAGVKFEIAGFRRRCDRAPQELRGRLGGARPAQGGGASSPIGHRHAARDESRRRAAREARQCDAPHLARFDRWSRQLRG